MGDNQENSRLNDTICAVATAVGRGGIGIVRVSGPKAKAIAEKILKTSISPRTAKLLNFHDQKGNVIDKGIGLFFQNPNSFTGEDILELQAHGGPVLLDMLMHELLALGCRQARPGEFSERAFLNSKIDLTQAEAIADMIDAASSQAVRSAGRSLQGEFSREVNKLTDGLVDLRSFIEAAIDFPEEEIDFIKNSDVSKRLLMLEKKLKDILKKAKTGNILQEGMTLVIAGQPNAGKSSLLNCLAGKDSAIVTDIPGTTRDILKEYIQIDGMPLHILDTAGLRETEDQIEQEGVKRAWAEIEKADGLLLVVDDNKGLMAEDKKIIEKTQGQLPVTVLFNKSDQTGRQIAAGEAYGLRAISISAKNCQGLELLKARLKELMGYTESGEGAFLARRRHLSALEKALINIKAAKAQVQNTKAPELAAEDLRKAQECLGQIAGDFKADDLLGKIFSDFCIGK